MNQYKNPIAQTYRPENVLILMSQVDQEVARQLGLELALRGTSVHAENDDLTAAVLLENGKYDVVITGMEFPHVAQYVKSRPAEDRPLAVAVSTNGVKADIKLHNTRDLIGYVRSGLLDEHYREHMTGQAIRAEEQSPEMAYALLECELMRSTDK
ncbi:MAG: hypothetical protein KKD17_00680 [Nanoarchaeota archaeon]|nr:hypothetical protein [Nanoarchaeota archaeon]